MRTACEDDSGEGVTKAERRRVRVPSRTRSGAIGSKA